MPHLGDIVNNGLHFSFREEYGGFGFDLYVADENDYIVGQSDPGMRKIALPATFKGFPIGAKLEGPLLKMDKRDAQRLIDELWRSGIRPSNGEGNVGQIGAMEKHLSDMRVIVQKQLEVDFK